MLFYLHRFRHLVSRRNELWATNATAASVITKSECAVIGRWSCFIECQSNYESVWTTAVHGASYHGFRERANGKYSQIHTQYAYKHIYIYIVVLSTLQSSMGSLMQSGRGGYGTGGGGGGGGGGGPLNNFHVFGGGSGADSTTPALLDPTEFPSLTNARGQNDQTLPQSNPLQPPGSKPYGNFFSCEFKTKSTFFIILIYVTISFVTVCGVINIIHILYLYYANNVLFTTYVWHSSSLFAHRIVLKLSCLLIALCCGVG